MANPRNNMTAAERRRFTNGGEYALPLTFWRDAPRATAAPSTLYFKHADDRREFAALFRAVNYETIDAEVR